LDSTGIITKQANLKTLADLETGTIGILNHSNAITVIRSALPMAKLVGVNSYEEAFNLLENQKIDGFAADNSVLTGWTQEHPDYHTLPVHLSQYAIAVVMPRGQQYWGLRQTVNQAINEWQKSGWLQERAKYWGLSN
jgi:polar amino acid transport system substrate-binding protein